MLDAACFISKDTVKFRGEEWKWGSHANINPQKTAVPMFMSDKVDSNTRHVIRNKERFYSD